MSLESRAKLNSEDMAAVRAAIFLYLEGHDFITNRLLRGLTNIGYDQAISVFGSMVRQGELNKVGIASGTRYILPSKK